MQSRDRVDLFQAQGVEFQRGLAQAQIVGLVGAQKDGTAGAAQNVGHLLVGGSETAGDVGDKDDHVGLLDRQFGLSAHQGNVGGGILRQHLFGPGSPPGNDGLGQYFDTARVHHDKVDVVPFGRSVQPVAGRARLVMHHRQPLADDTVEEGAFTHVRPAHEGHDGDCRLRIVDCRLHDGPAR